MKKPRKKLPPRTDIKPKILYAVVDLWNNEEMLCVGDIHEIAAYTGAKESTIRSFISHTKKSGDRCKYVRIGLLDDEDMEEGDEE